MAGREDHAGWSHVWRDMLKYPDSWPGSVTLPNLLGWGVDWLGGREDWSDWALVWQGLLEHADYLPNELSPNLLDLGVTWLIGREDDASWSRVWQAVLKNASSLPDEVTISNLLRMGVDWLTGREDLADWAFVWQALLARTESLPVGTLRSSLLGTGATWLAGHEGVNEWSHVCEKLLDAHFQDRDFFELAAEWLKHTCEKPQWPLLAAKFIVAVPDHSASAEFADNLTQRIKACPNNGHWYKTVDFVRDLTNDVVLQPRVREWLKTLRARSKAPAWTEARRHLNAGLSVKGRVIAIKSNYCSVELEIGLIAIWPNTSDGIRRTIGLVRSFSIQRLDPEKSLVRVRLDMPVVLEVGSIHVGFVTGVKEYGVFLRIGSYSGLLHRRHLPSGLDIQSHYIVGQSLRIQVAEIKKDGKIALALPSAK